MLYSSFPSWYDVMFQMKTWRKGGRGQVLYSPEMTEHTFISQSRERPEVLFTKLLRVTVLV